MQRNNFFNKTVIVILASKVKLANRHGVVASGAQAVRPTAHAAIVGVSIVPAMIFSNVGASVQTSSIRRLRRGSSEKIEISKENSASDCWEFAMKVLDDVFEIPDDGKSVGTS